MLTGEIGRLVEKMNINLKKKALLAKHVKISSVFAPLHYRLKSAKTKDHVDECFPLAGFIIG